MRAFCGLSFPGCRGDFQGWTRPVSFWAAALGIASGKLIEPYTCSEAFFPAYGIQFSSMRFPAPKSFHAKAEMPKARAKGEMFLVADEYL